MLSSLIPLSAMGYVWGKNRLPVASRKALYPSIEQMTLREWKSYLHMARIFQSGLMTLNRCYSGIALKILIW